MSDYENNEEVVETMDESEVEEIPPTQNNYTNNTSYEQNEQRTVNEEYDDDSDEKMSKILGIVSLVCGIISLLCCCLGWVSVVLSIAAIVCGIISIKKSDVQKGIAIAGIVCGGIALVLSAILLFAVGFLGAITDMIDGVDYIDEFF